MLRVLRPDASDEVSSCGGQCNLPIQQFGVGQLLAHIGDGGRIRVGVRCLL